jgi:hypothetical protein
MGVAGMAVKMLLAVTSAAVPHFAVSCARISPTSLLLAARTSAKGILQRWDS